MAYESVYEDKQEEGLSMRSSFEYMALGLSISYVYHIAHTNTKSRLQWSRGRGSMSDYWCTSAFDGELGQECMQYCEFQRFANSHRTEAQIAFLEIVDTISSGPGTKGGLITMRTTFTADAFTKRHAPLSKRCAYMSLFMPWIPILDGLLFLDLPV